MQRLAVLLLVSLVLPSWVVAGEEFEVSFVRPSPAAVLLGEVQIELALRLPHSAEVARVELRVDGELLATLTAPPWSAAWNAGEGQAHEIQARVILADGREAGARVRTSPLRVDHVERVDLVDLYVTVRDRAGGYVTNLTADDFVVFEDGVPQKIERCTTSRQPLKLALVLDTSVSMAEGDRLGRARAAAIDFLDVLEPGDEGLIVGFSDDVRLLHELSADREALAQALRATAPQGGTALYDAIWRTAQRLRDVKGRRVVVLLSDGRDEAANGLEPGSLHTLEEAIDQSLKSEVILFTLGVGRDLEREYAMRWGRLDGGSNVDTQRSLAAILRDLAERTGGRAVLTASSGKVQRAFAQFADDLRHQYSIAFASRNPARDGTWRTLRVETPGRELTVVTRQGYFAAGPATD